MNSPVRNEFFLRTYTACISFICIIFSFSKYSLRRSSIHNYIIIFQSFCHHKWILVQLTKNRVYMYIGFVSVSHMQCTSPSKWWAIHTTLSKVRFKFKQNKKVKLNIGWFCAGFLMHAGNCTENCVQDECL